jgi:hypothetical protein
MGDGRYANEQVRLNIKLALTAGFSIAGRPRIPLEVVEPPLICEFVIGECADAGDRRAE